MRNSHSLCVQVFHKDIFPSGVSAACTNAPTWLWGHGEWFGHLPNFLKMDFSQALPFKVLILIFKVRNVAVCHIRRVGPTQLKVQTFLCPLCHSDCCHGTEPNLELRQFLPAGEITCTSSNLKYILTSAG